MSKLAYIADKTILAPDKKNVLVNPKGATSDIIKQIMFCDKNSAIDTARFAEYLKGENKIQTCKNVWQFVKDHIKYVLDPMGEQYIKTPARTWDDRFADCKGYSIFIGSILKNLGINASYRFVSFSNKPIYTHVYVVVPNGSNTILIDDCMPNFNEEKKFTFKKDLEMTKIVQMSGLGCPGTGRNVKRGRNMKNASNRSPFTGRGVRIVARPLRKMLNLGNKDITQISEGEMDLRIAKDRLMTEKAILERKRGIGSLKAERYQDAIDVMEDALDVIDSPEVMEEIGMIYDDAINGIYSNASAIAGIGDINGRKARRRAKRAARKQRRATKKAARGGKTKAGALLKKAKGKTGAFLKKAATKAKKGLKAVAKVATAPARLAIKGILEVLLPKAAPMFLYLFINEKSIIDKLPAKVRAKRKKQEKAAEFIIEGIGMKRTHFMGIVRNGIMKKFGKSPEQVLAASMKAKISGIGTVPPEAIQAGVSVLMEIFKKIAQFFKKKKAEKIGAEDGPSDDDWDGDTSLEGDILGQDDTGTLLGEDGEDYGGGDDSGGRKVWNSFGG